MITRFWLNYKLFSDQKYEVGTDTRGLGISQQVELQCRHTVPGTRLLFITGINDEQPYFLLLLLVHQQVKDGVRLQTLDFSLFPLLLPEIGVTSFHNIINGRSSLARGCRDQENH